MRGKQSDKQTIYNIMASYAVTNNYAETGRILNIPASTVEKTVKDNRGKPEFVELCAQKKEEFADRCTGIIDNIVLALDQKVKAALENQEVLDKMKLTELSTSLAIIYDKRALALGNSTDNVTFNLPDEVKEYAE